MITHIIHLRIVVFLYAITSLVQTQIGEFFTEIPYGEISAELNDLSQIRYELLQSSEIHCLGACVEETGCRHALYDNNQCYLIGDGSMPGEVSSYIIPVTDVIFKKYRPEFASCAELAEEGYTDDGVYMVNPDSQGEFEVYCELDPVRTDGSTQPGWTVFQRRVDASVDFYRYWSDYEEGFGDIEGNYWLGLRKLARLTASAPVQLHIYLEAFDNDWSYALYNSFQISDASSNYMLIISGYSGTAGDALQYVHNRQFTTRDRDNDPNSNNCAVVYKGAFWYNSCHYANLNGLYHGGDHSTFADGINWNPFRGYHYSLKTTIMKIRPL